VRFNESQRWTKLLQSKLGSNYEIIEEGMPGRTISSTHWQGKRGFTGANHIIPILEKHQRVDLIIIMLGTNETKPAMNSTAKQIAQMLELDIINRIQKYNFPNGRIPQLLIIAPAKINAECTRPYGKYNEHSEIVSAQLENEFQLVASSIGCSFLSAVDLGVGTDGVHLTEASHAELASRICKHIKDIVKNC
jgi:lysophospholipase L1-like esterase